MSVSTFQQTNANSQSAASYQLLVDGNFSVLTRLGDSFAPHAQASPSMTLSLDPGHVFDGTTLTEVAAQTTGAFTAPITNPRIDRVVIDQLSGVLAVVTGAEAASPIPPAIPAGTVPVAQVLLQTSSSSIINNMLIDERDLTFLGGAGGSGITGITAGTGLTGGGASGDVTVSLATPVAVDNGGTGASAAGPAAANNIGALAITSNLSDLANEATARTNLGLGSMATENASSVAITGGTITGLPSPVNASDAATKAYVDATASGLSVRDSVAAATTAILPNSPAYSNGTGGVGATLTATTNGALTLDGYSVNVSDRLLVKTQVAGLQNGLYTVTAAGGASATYVLTRAAEANSSTNLFSGIFVFVEQGTVNTGAGFVLTTPNPITVGTTALTFTQFSGAGEITAGIGISKSGNTITLATPTASTIGGVESLAAVTHRWINSISTGGVPSATQPAFSDISGQATLSQLSGVAPLNSPSFTGTPTAPTPTVGDNSTKLATTAFISTAIGAAASYGATVTNPMSANLVLTGSGAQVQTVNPNAAGLAIQLPAANTMPRLGSQVFVFKNIGVFPVQVIDVSSALIGWVLPGAVVPMLLEDNSSVAGVWRVMTGKMEVDNGIYSDGPFGILAYWIAGDATVVQLSQNYGVVCFFAVAGTFAVGYQIASEGVVFGTTMAGPLDLGGSFDACASTETEVFLTSPSSCFTIDLNTSTLDLTVNMPTNLSPAGAVGVACENIGPGIVAVAWSDYSSRLELAIVSISSGVCIQHAAQILDGSFAPGYIFISVLSPALIHVVYQTATPSIGLVRAVVSGTSITSSSTPAYVSARTNPIGIFKTSATTSVAIYQGTVSPYSIYMNEITDGSTLTQNETQIIYAPGAGYLLQGAAFPVPSGAVVLYAPAPGAGNGNFAENTLSILKNGTTNLVQTRFSHYISAEFVSQSQFRVKPSNGVACVPWPSTEAVSNHPMYAFQAVYVA